MAQNLADGGNRQFILVQLDENINEKKNKTAYEFCKNTLKSGNPTIFDITKERIIRAKNQLIQENKDKDLSSFDLDFKIYEIEKKDAYIEEIQSCEGQRLPLYMYDRNTVFNTWKLYDGIKLHENFKEVKLNGYTAYLAGDDKLYLIDPYFTHDHLAALVEKLDSDKDFKPKIIVFYETNLDSHMQRELSDNFGVLTNKKSIEVKTIQRHL